MVQVVGFGVQGSGLRANRMGRSATINSLNTHQRRYSRRMFAFVKICFEGCDSRIRGRKEVATLL